MGVDFIGVTGLVDAADEGLRRETGDSAGLSSSGGGGIRTAATCGIGDGAFFDGASGRLSEGFNGLSCWGT